MDKFFNGPFSETSLMSEVEQPGKTFLIALVDDQPAGYALLMNSTDSGLYNAMEIARFYLTTAYLGKGIGKKFMEACLDFARQLKKNTVWLGVWEKNKRAISFYQRFGFEKFGTHVFRLGDDRQTDLLMKLNLQDTPKRG